ncbi:MAG TPA: fibronectin type III domain-containing protein [Vicinamibacterales bacterium]|nr:fibronectin type III domain-containing protein [Vicinamibacterales bacterium]
MGVRTNGNLNNAARMVAMAIIMVAVSASAAWAQQTVTAMWDTNTDPYTAGYRVYYGTAPGSYQWNVDAGNQTSAPVNLTPGSTYYFAVRAYNASYQLGPASNEATINLGTPTPPPPPTAQITATLTGATTALVSWQTTNATSATINGGSVGTSGSTSVTVTARTTFTLVARASDGRTATASATVTPTPPPPAPPPTAQITATLQDAPGSSAPQPSYTAVINWQTANAVAATINGVSVALSGSTSVTVSATTTFALVATAADGRTATATSTVNITSPATPGAPTHLASNVSGSRVTLSWRAPTSGGTPTHYLIYIGTAAGRTDVANGYAVGNVLSVSTTLPRGRFYARVRAANAVGTSADSNQVQFRVGRWLRTPGGFQVTWRGTVAVLSWAPSSGDVPEDVPSGYIVEAGSQPGMSDIATVNVGDVTSFEADVPPGLFYVRVRAVNPLGDSDPTEELVLSPPGAPTKPHSLSASGSGSTVDLRWIPGAGGAPPAGYVIEAGSASGLSDLAVLPVGNVPQFVTTAPPGVYYVRVRAVNARGPSEASNEIVVRR